MIIEKNQGNFWNEDMFFSLLPVVIEPSFTCWMLAVTILSDLCSESALVVIPSCGGSRDETTVILRNVSTLAVILEIYISKTQANILKIITSYYANDRKHVTKFSSTKL